MTQDTDNLGGGRQDDVKPATGITAKILYLSQWTDSIIYRAFRNLGAAIHKRTYWFLFVPLLIALICASGMMKLEVQWNAEQLYTPQVSRTF